MATYVPEGTPGPATTDATPTPGVYAPPAADTVNTAETPQAITGTVYITGTAYLTNPNVQSLPPLTPDVAGASLALVVSYCLVWPWLTDNVRYVLALVGVFCCFLMVWSGTPQYMQGWYLLAVGLLVWGPFRVLVRGWRNRRGA